MGCYFHILTSVNSHIIKSLLHSKTGILFRLQTRREFLYGSAVQQKVTGCMLLRLKELPANHPWVRSSSLLPANTGIAQRLEQWAFQGGFDSRSPFGGDSVVVARSIQVAQRKMGCFLKNARQKTRSALRPAMTVCSTGVK
jgi:hypothetical protein